MCCEEVKRCVRCRKPQTERWYPCKIFLAQPQSVQDRGMSRCNWALASYPRTVGMLPRGVCPDPECVRKYRKENGIKDDVPVPPPENPETASAAEGDAEKGQEGET